MILFLNLIFLTNESRRVFTNESFKQASRLFSKLKWKHEDHCFIFVVAVMRKG